MSSESKKRILFILRNFEHGGIPRVLANLLERVDTSQLDIDVYPIDPAGIFRDRMTHCRVLSSNFLLRCLSCNYRIEKFFIKVPAIFFKIIRHVLKKCIHKDILHFAERLVARRFHNQYDVLWACSEDSAAKIAVSVRSSKKILWIHNCCSQECLNMFAKQSLVDYTAFDRIVCVANHVADSLVTNLRELYGIDVSSRVFVMRNIVNQDEILKSSEELIEDQQFNTDCFTVVSVGRLAWEKRLEVIPEIVAKVKSSEKSLRWYLIGDGAPVMWQILKNEIKKWNVCNEVILLGIKKNPYPYIARADALALTSRMEAYPTVVNEALALGTYVMAVNIAGMEEIVPNGRGNILSIDEMPDKLLELISRKEKAGSIKLAPFDFSKHNEEILRKFMKVLFE